MNKPDLKFWPNMPFTTGFTSAGISAFSDLKSVAVVRELIQNSLDAALIGAKKNCAKVQFKRTTCKLNDIPGINSYKRAFNQSVKTLDQKNSGELNRQGKLVADRISKALQNENQEVLYITDNGIGLDKVRMEALLCDGVSAKSGSSAGTYGNGHTAIFPASNLRYILYGGVSKNDGFLASGEAILASHKKTGEIYYSSANGVYINSFNKEDDSSQYNYPSGSSIPKFIKNALDEIKSKHGQGSAIIIPSFNQFEDYKLSLTDIVFEAASCNFFQAIHSGQLIIEVEDQVDKQKSSDKAKKSVLNEKNIQEILAEYKENKGSISKPYALTFNSLCEAGSWRCFFEFKVIEP